MKNLWFRRAFLALACVGAALTSACGDGSVVSDLDPKRFISVGDGFTDVGQLGYRYTINDGSLTWNQYLASHYDQTITAASAGGWGYSQGGARVNSADTTSGTNAPSVKEQIDTMLARIGTFTNNDVMMINGGMEDIVAAVNETGISDATTATVKAAGTALGEQTKRLVSAGATHVVVTGVSALGFTPWARGLGQKDAINKLVTAFNDALKISLVDYGKTVLYFDAAQFFTLTYNEYDNYGLDNRSDPVCTTPDVTTCTPSTLLAGADSTEYLFADKLYMTPDLLRKFASTSYSANIHTVFKNRW